MVLTDTFHLALSAFRSNKMRSLLTLLGIIIGVMTIIAMQSLITGLRKSINEQVSSLGSSVFQVQKFPAINMGPHDHDKYRNRKDITYADALAVRERVTAAKAVGAEVWNWGAELRYKDRKTLPNIQLAGVTPEFLENNGLEIAEGRFITAEDVDLNVAVTVIGADVVDKLFPFEDPLGKDIKLMGRRFEVVGIFEKKGSAFGQSQDNRIAIPFFQFTRLYGKERSINITVQAATPALVETATEQTIGVMRTQRKVKPGIENDFEIYSNETITGFFDNITKYVRIVAIAIASISLLVAGVGIMNIMLVSVTERTREIGIRKSVGAKRSDILWQFLIEAIVLSELGGLIGIMLGLGIGKLVDALTPIPAAVPVWTVFLGLIFCSFVGLVFGVYPALKAARMDPITALRYE
ncbi:MAG TPA: ABC transporter permease [bacterium]|nr:ABC transporter permease [bacterium]HOC24024.1 ABC transporter permease [bacterium]HOH07037.1 ABC transporter permease [bacterium]HOY43637.1 ABC transporter permease [bacterium]HPG81835.1 ABC transporter permease [bacterium]